MSQVAENFETVKKRLRSVSKRWKLENPPPKIVAVSKQQNESRIRKALDYGHRIFGENRVQDSLDKWNEETGFRSEYKNIQLHMIGSLQSNKVAEAVHLFDVIETLDRTKLADILKKEIEKQNKNIEIFIQVNTGEEEQKSGVLPKNLSDLIGHCRNIDLAITGLMCLPPANEPAGLHFAFLKTLAEKNGLSNVSIGMSGDFEKAIPLSPKYMRIGSGIFGARS